MTGRLNPAVEMMLMAAGAVRVLAKPFNQNEMAFHIAAALNRRYLNTGGDAASTSASTAAEIV